MAATNNMTTISIKSKSNLKIQQALLLWLMWASGHQSIAQTPEDWARLLGDIGAVTVIREYMQGPKIRIVNVRNCNQITFEMSGNCLNDIQWIWPDASTTRSNPASYTFNQEGEVTIFARGGSKVSSLTLRVSDIDASLNGSSVVVANSTTSYNYFLRINNLTDDQPLPPGYSVSWQITGGTFVTPPGANSRSVAAVWHNICGNEIKATLRTPQGCNVTKFLNPAGSGLSVTLRDITGCEGSKIFVKADLISVNPIASITWNAVQEDGFPVINGRADGLNFEFETNMKATVYIQVRDVLGCISRAQANVTLKKPTEKDDLEIFATRKSCFEYEFSANGWCEPNFLWLFPDGTTSTDETPRHRFPSVGQYNVELRHNNRVYTKTIRIEIPVTTIVGPSNASHRGVDTYRISTNPPNPRVAFVDWAAIGSKSLIPDASNLSASVEWFENCDVTKKIIAFVKFEDGCEVTIERVLESAANFQVRLGPVSLCPGDNIRLAPELVFEGERTFRYRWRTSSGQVSNEPVLQFAPFNETEVHLTVTDSLGCEASARTTVRISGKRFFDPNKMSVVTWAKNLLTEGRDVDTSADGSLIAFSSTKAHEYVPIQNAANREQVYLVDSCNIYPISLNVSGNTMGNARSSSPSISSDGRYVLFWTLATDVASVVPVRTSAVNPNPPSLVLVDRHNNTRRFVNLDYNGRKVGSGPGRISNSGNFIVWMAEEYDVVPLLASKSRHISREQLYLTDLRTNKTTLVSAEPDSLPGVCHHCFQQSLPNTITGTARQGMVSDDGRWVVFLSNFDRLVAGDTNEKHDVFLRDMLTQKTIRVGTNAVVTNQAIDMSPDGQYIVFLSSDSLVPGMPPLPSNAQWQVYRYNRVTKEIQLASRANFSHNTPGNGNSRFVSISDNGRVLFASSSTNLLNYSLPPGLRVFQADFQQSSTPATVKLVSNPDHTSTAYLGSAGNIYATCISPDGKAAVWSSPDFTTLVIPNVPAGSGNQIYRSPTP